MKLGFLTARSVAVGSTLQAEAGLGRLIDALGERFGGIQLAASPMTELPSADHVLAVPTEAFIALPVLPSAARGFFRAGSARRAIRALESRCDVLLAQVPFAAPLALGGATRPRVYEVCADVRGFVSAAPRFAGLRGAPFRAAGVMLAAYQRYLTGKPRTRVVAHGRALLSQYGVDRGRAVVSSAIRGSEIGCIARRRPRDAPFRVLFVGFLRHEKGFDTLVEAFTLLRGEMPLAELEIVGSSHGNSDAAARDLRLRLENLKATGAARLVGHVGFGRELFGHYADADVLVLPSVSEGTPRVLVEARAFGCPVIASDVGGIPTSVRDGHDGLLVPPGDVQSLFGALLRLARNAELHAGLSARGLERARELTLERFVADIAAEIELAVGSTHALPAARRSGR